MIVRRDDVPRLPVSLPRQPDCSACPHEHHLRACDHPSGCGCDSPPIPGIYLD